MSKFPLKSGFLAALFILAAILNINIYSGGNGLNTGEQCPNSEVLIENIYDPSMNLRSTTNLYDYKQDKTLLIAFMPDISDKNKYAQVMTSAFNTYFAEGMAFGQQYEWESYRNSINVLVVTNNDQSLVREYLDQNDYSFDMASDINLDLAHSFGISTWGSSNDGSFVYVVDKNNRITYASHDYKGEGEKLRAVQKELFAELSINDPMNNLVLNNKLLFTGDDAPEFDFTYTDLNTKTQSTASLQDYIGKKNVIIAFYPAPYSMSCAMEVKSFDAYAENQTLDRISNSRLGGDNDVEILMISNSGINILNKWKKDMQLNNVKLVSDYGGDISALYSSNNPLGYFNRTLFIVDKTGKISYINWNYNVDDKDFGIVRDHLAMLAEK